MTTNNATQGTLVGHEVRQGDRIVDSYGPLDRDFANRRAQWLNERHFSPRAIADNADFLFRVVEVRRDTRWA